MSFSKRNNFLRFGSGLTLIVVLVTWLNSTAMPAVINVAFPGIVIATLALILSGIGLNRSLKQPVHRIGLITGIISVTMVLGLGAWLMYDGFLSFKQLEVSFENDDVTLAGTVYLPTNGCPCPAAVLIHGSGRQTRDEYRFYARKLAQNGIIGLAYDKRGTGDSSGKLYGGGYEEYAKDALAGLNFLRERNDVKEDEVGFIGYSEGEWVAPIAFTVATEKPNYLIIVGASGLSPSEQVNEEITIRLSSMGFDTSTISQAISINEKVLHFQRTGENRDSLLTTIQRYRNEHWFIASEDIPRSDEELGQFEHYNWWRSVMDTNPDRLWSQVDVPVLFLKGEKDDRSRADIAKRKLTAALKLADNKNVEFIHFTEADHMILEWPMGKGVPPPTFSDGYLDNIVEWIFCKLDN